MTDKLYGVGLPGMFAPTPRVADFGLTAFAQPFLHSRDNEGLPMFGVTLTALALIGLIVAWRQRRAWQLALLWLGCAALALGMSLWVAKRQFVPWTQDWNGVRVSPFLPYTWFVRIPGLSAFREADRMAILGLVPAALLAGAAVNWMRYHARPLIAVVIALAHPGTGVLREPEDRRDADVVPPAGCADRRRPLPGRWSSTSRTGCAAGSPSTAGGSRPRRWSWRPPTVTGAPSPTCPGSPQATLNAIEKHAFFSHLIKTQHFTFPPVTVPLTAGAAAPAVVRQETVVLYAAERGRGRGGAAGRPATGYRVGRGVVLKSRHCAIFAPDRLPLCLPGR